MKSNTYELHNYAELDMELEAKDATGLRKRKASITTGEKYSLRQKRQKRNPGELSSSQPAPPTSPADELQPEPATATATAGRKARGSGKSPAKTKAPPLSKYRRKTANARERTRMREINMAFEQLRHCVPQSITGDDAANTNEKLTKITTLRLAMKYIGMLSESLQDPSYESEFLVECLRESANREAHVSLDTDPELELELEAEHEPELELELEPLPQAKAKKPSKSSKKTIAKRQSKASSAKATKTTTTASSSPESCYASSSVGSPAFCVAACSPSSAYASLSSSASTSSNSSNSSSGGSINGSAPIDTDSLVDMQVLSGLLMESDSESMHCLDPHVNANSYHSLLGSAGGTGLPARGDLPISISHSPLDKPDVELSLRLLDHSTDSFDFANDQQPSACISPLATLDSYHPFSDLLHGDFPDLFLA